MAAQRERSQNAILPWASLDGCVGLGLYLRRPLPIFNYSRKRDTQPRILLGSGG
jgi:hypothetical protein